MKRAAFFFVIALGLAASAPLAMGAPSVVPYAGLLSFESGVPYDGTVDVVVTAYDLPSGGQVLWGPESHPNTPVHSGVFSLLLGSAGVPISAAFLGANAPYLEFSVGGTTLVGRQAVGAAPFALQAANAAAIGGTPAAQVATSAAVPGLAVAAVQGATGLALSGPLDLNSHPPADFRFLPAATAPVTCDATRVGYAFFDTAAGAVQVCNGTAFVGLGSGSGSTPGGGGNTGTLVPGNTTMEVQFEGVKARCRQWSGIACQIAEINPTGAAWFTPSGPNHLNSWYIVQNMESYGAAGYKWFCYYAAQGNGAGIHTGGSVTVPNTAKYAWIQGTSWPGTENSAANYYKSSGSVPNQPAGMAFELNRFDVTYQSTSIVCSGW
jgi:hypothetical protein